MSRIFEIFAGEFVQLTLRKDDKSTVGDSRGNPKVIQSSFVVQGFLLEECDDYYYLTYAPESGLINSAICRNDVILMERIDSTNEELEMAEMLDQSVGPKDTGVN